MSRPVDEINIKEVTNLKNEGLKGDFILSIPNVVPTGFKSSSLCKISNELFNTRLINYSINKTNRFFHLLSNDSEMEAEPIRTLNLLNGKYLMKEVFNVPFYGDAMALGIEDIRLINTSRNETHFLGTSSCFNVENENRVCSGLYNSKNKEIIVNCVFPSPTKSTCEKNWVFFNENEIIYNWFPISIYTLKSFDLVKIIQTPQIFSTFRGSSSVIEYGDFKYVVTHSVVNCEKPMYFHYLIIMDKYGVPVSYSKPFTFEGEHIEFCLSILLLDGDIIQFHYSLWDNCSKEVNVPLSFFEDKLIEI